MSRRPAQPADPLIALADRHRDVWKGVDADAYVRSLREGSSDARDLGHERLRVSAQGGTLSARVKRYQVQDARSRRSIGDVCADARRAAGETAREGNRWFAITKPRFDRLPQSLRSMRRVRRVTRRSVPTGIKAPDAIQLVCRRGWRRSFITNDDRLSRKHVPDVKFITSLSGRNCSSSLLFPPLPNGRLGQGLVAMKYNRVEVVSQSASPISAGSE